MIEDRIYQNRAVEATWNHFQEGGDSGLVVMPTGTGKTTVAGRLIARCHAERQERTLFLGHRQVIVEQSAADFREMQIHSEIEMGGKDAARSARLSGVKPAVVCGSLQSLQGQRLYDWPKSEFANIFIDEAHHAPTQLYANIIDHFEGFRILGFTATPERGDWKNLGSVFGTFCHHYPLLTAIKGDPRINDPGHWLVPPYVFRCQIPIDLKGIRFKGDFNIGDLEERIGPHLEVIARAIRKEHNGRQTVVFCPDVGSTQGLCNVLQQLEEADPIGATATWVGGSGGRFSMSDETRARNLASYESGRTRIVVNCELLVEAWNHPPTKCVVICRPTLQRYRFAQMVGRGLRLSRSSGYKDCIVIDFDWQTEPGCRSLASVVDLFDDDSMPEAVIRTARALAQADPEEDDPVALVEEAQKLLRVKYRLQIRLTGKSAEYARQIFDPVGASKILDLGLKKRHDYDNDYRPNPATPAQLDELRRRGLEDVDRLSKWGASKILTKLERRDRDGLADFDQVRSMLRRGVGELVAQNIGKAEARAQIDDLDRIDALPPSVQMELFRR